MNPEISSEEIKIANNFLTKAKRKELTREFVQGRFSNNDLNNTYPVLMKLLEYGIGLLEKEGKPDYQSLHESGKKRQEDILNYCMHRPEVFETLINLYAQSKTKNQNHKIFSKRISDMSGYEFASFLVQIGVIDNQEFDFSPSELEITPTSTNGISSLLL